MFCVPCDRVPTVPGLDPGYNATAFQFIRQNLKFTCWYKCTKLKNFVKHFFFPYFPIKNVHHWALVGNHQKIQFQALRNIFFLVSQLSENYHFNTFVLFWITVCCCRARYIVECVCNGSLALMSVKCSHVTFISTNNKQQTHVVVLVFVAVTAVLLSGTCGSQCSATVWYRNVTRRKICWRLIGVKGKE